MVAHIHCPSCGALDVRESHSHNLVDALMRLFGMVAYRCRACRTRFHKRPPSEDAANEIAPQDAGAENSESDRQPR
jgi:DNA-directed RNA polymerase subunit RPC12/RpoP